MTHLELPDPERRRECAERAAVFPGMDERIKPLVGALWARGIPTVQSCEGHPDDFPHGVWYPWVYLGVDDLNVTAPARAWWPHAELRARGDREWTGPVQDLLYHFGDDVGWEDDEVFPMVLPLGGWGLAALIPSGFGPGSPAHRLIGAALGVEGRREFHTCAWREFDLLTRWLNGETVTRA